MRVSNNQILRDQMRCMALGFNPGALDGLYGPRTHVAYTSAVTAQKQKGLPFRHPTGTDRIAIHWTGGPHKANDTDKKSYHVLVEGDGNIILTTGALGNNGAWMVRSHTWRFNTGAIGLSMCCMGGAVERPYDPGFAPMTPIQLAAMCGEAARLCKLYDIPVTPWSTYTHAEVQPRFGVVQKQKWDITILPGMDKPMDALVVGDMIRDRIRAKM